MAEQLDQPIVKAWNPIGSASFARKGKPAIAHDCLAIPVAADRDEHREIAMRLIDDTALDAFAASSLAVS